VKEGRMRCPSCEDEDCIHIEINLNTDERLQFYSCRRCEAKWWERDGDTIELDEVLTLTAESEAR
jgi:transposase-like protein